MSNEPMFILIAKLAEKFGATPIKDKIWVHQIDEEWLVAVNGFKVKKKTEAIGQANISIELPPFAVYVEFNGWPAGMFNPYEGSFAAGEAANEHTFREAVEKALRATT